MSHGRTQHGIDEPLVVKPRDVPTLQVLGVASNPTPLGESMPIRAIRFEFDISGGAIDVPFYCGENGVVSEYRLDILTPTDDATALFSVMSDLAGAPNATVWSWGLAGAPGRRVMLLLDNTGQPGGPNGWFRVTWGTSTKGHAIAQIGVIDYPGFKLTGPNDL